MSRKVFLIFVLTLASLISMPIMAEADNSMITMTTKIVVSAKDNASRDPRNGHERGVKLYLAPGVWRITPIAGGWSAWRSDSEVSPDKGGPWTWNLYIKRCDEQRSLCYGNCSDWWIFGTLSEASEYATKKLEPIKLTLNSPCVITFWIYDSGGINDNRGSVSLAVEKIE